jgi:murein tripeptide amidase MpaA
LPDRASDVVQWFAFRVGDDTQRTTELVIENAASSTYPDGWPAYRALASDDGRRWRRVPTDYDGSALRILHEPRAPRTYYAYFALYAQRRLASLLGRIAPKRHVDVDVLGESAEGRPMWRAAFGDGDAPRTIWIIARQHPGETPASFAAHGLLERLADRRDPAVRALLSRADVHVVPLVDVDGAALGHMRTTSTGLNLNRVWDDPDGSPEVSAILEGMDATGVDLFVDVHADETAAFAFAACSEGNPSYDERIADDEAALRHELASSVREFRDVPGYPLDPPGAADLSCASNQVGEAWQIPSITLELPIVDLEHGEPTGWSPLRAERVGRAMVDALARYVLRW